MDKIVKLLEEWNERQENRLLVVESRMDNLEDNLTKLRDDIRDQLDLFCNLTEHIKFRNGSLILKNCVIEKE